jgi:PAS domain S-box-containing protein
MATPTGARTLCARLLPSPRRNTVRNSNSPLSSHPPESPAPTRAELNPASDVLQDFRENEAMLAAAQRLAKLGSWSLNVKTDALKWSSETYRIFALPQTEFENFTLVAFLEFVHPDDRSELKKIVHQARAGQMSFSYRYRFLGRGGEEKSLRGDGESQLDSNGKVCRLVGTVMDVTEQEQMRQAFELREARLRTLTDSGTEWLWEQDEEFRFTLLAEGRDNKRKLQHAPAIGKRRWEIADCTPAQGSWDEHRHVVQARRPFRDFEYVVKTGSSTRVISTSGIPIYGPAGQFLGYRGTAHDITALKNATANSEKAEGLLKLATRLGRVGSWTLAIPEMKVTPSREFLVIHEMEAHVRLTFEGLVALVHPEWSDVVHQAMETCATEGVPFDVEVKALTAKGKTIWVRLIGEPVRGLDGEIRGIQGAVQDISDRREAAERLRRLSEKLTATIDSISDGFITLALDGTFTYVNNEAERLMGSSRSELIGKLPLEEFPGFMWTEFRTACERALAEGTTGRLTVHSSTVGRWLGVTVYPSAQGVAVHIRDITENRNVRRALVESEERYRLLFESSLDAMFETSLEGKLLRANTAACTMFRSSEESLRALEPGGLVSPTDGRFQAMKKERELTGKATSELTMVRSDGSYFEAEITTSTYPIGHGTFRRNLVIRDITERLQFQQEILALNATLSERVRQRTSQLELANDELKSFAHALAHDLRAPIAAIKGFGARLDASLKQTGSDEERHYSDRIGTAAQRMDDYVEALLSLAKISQAPIQMVTVNLSSIATSVLDELQDQDRSRLLTRDVQDDVQTWGDERLLRMLLQNLLGNAWKFTGRRERAQISFAAHTETSGEVTYSVRDNGAGFDMAYAGKLFGSFQRLHSESEFPGIGIGLANAQRIVLRHGGWLWAESREGEGATFNFTLAATPSDVGPT